MLTLVRGRHVLVAAFALGATLVPASVGTSATAADPCGDTIAKPSGGAWACTFVDDFGGKSLDTSKWVVADTSKTGFRTGSTCYRNERGNVAVRRGTLHLTVKRENSPFVCRSPYGDFTTQYSGGGVTTAGKFSQTYGRFEIRARYPSTRNSGVHVAYWMHPAKLTYGAWPASGEIDIAEWYSTNPDTMYPSLHYNGRTWADTAWNCVIAGVDSWHRYTLEWGPDEMRFYYDGNLCFRRSWTPDSPLVAPQPFDHAFNTILTAGASAESGFNAVSDSTDLPAEFEIDYVKAWR